MGLKSMFAVRDMTEGKPWKRICEFAVPMIIGNVAQQLYNTADSVIVGKYVGDNALAAVGSAGPILFLLMAVMVGISTGAGIVIAQSFGAKDRERLSLNIGNSISLAAIGSLFIMLVGPLLTRPFLQLLGTPDTIIDWCTGYLNIFSWGVAGFFFYNILSGILRGMGDSISALAFLLVAAVLNVGFDLLFVAKFNMGVPGVALATVIAQFISAILCFIRLLCMKDVFDFSFKSLKLEKKIYDPILRLGLPSGITQGIMAAAGMMVQNLTNSMGEVVIACNVIIMRVDGFAMMPNMSFGQAMSVYTGQNVGARKFDRVFWGMKQGTWMALAFSSAVTVILLFLSRTLFEFFTNTPELVDLAVQMMRILAVGYICVAITQILGGVMRGAGDTVTPMWISMVSTIFLRVPIAYLLANLTKSAEFPKGMPFALFASLLISWVLGMLISIVVYKMGRWKKKMYEPIQTELD